MIVPAPEWSEILPGPYDPADWPISGDDDMEPTVPCDACGVLVTWAPPLGDHLDVETTSPHECQP